MQVTLIGKLLQEFRISYIRLKLVTWPLFLAKIRGMVYRFKCLERMIKLITFYIICASMNSKRKGGDQSEHNQQGGGLSPQWTKWLETLHVRPNLFLPSNVNGLCRGYVTLYWTKMPKVPDSQNFKSFGQLGAELEPPSLLTKLTLGSTFLFTIQKPPDKISVPCRLFL